MAEEEVEATLTSSKDQSRITSVVEKSSWITNLSLAAEKPHSHGQTEETASPQGDW